MASRQSIQLGQVQESLLVPLYARAVDALKKRPILKDPKAVEMVQSIDRDFQRFNQRRRVVGATLRTAMFDEWVRGFLSRHPEGTVVEIGAGLNTRFERLDNGTVHWFDLDLPDTVELRRKFFIDSGRRVTLAGSIVDPGWMAAVRQSPGPYCFVAEGVFIYLTEQEVKAALAQIAGNFPRASIAFDTATLKAISHENKDHARRKLEACLAWACEDPREIERWKIGLRR
jgi:O-methyltransferase involved in polyketide biosynthesis